MSSHGFLQVEKGCQTKEMIMSTFNGSKFDSERQCFVSKMVNLTSCGDGPADCAQSWSQTELCYCQGSECNMASSLSSSNLGFLILLLIWIGFWMFCITFSSLGLLLLLLLWLGFSNSFTSRSWGYCFCCCYSQGSDCDMASCLIFCYCGIILLFVLLLGFLVCTTVPVTQPYLSIYIHIYPRNIIRINKVFFEGAPLVKS